MNRKSNEIIQAAFRRKKNRNPAYSKSALARDCGVSSAFVSNLLTGKKAIPRDRFEKITSVLELDSSEKSELIQAILVNQFENTQLGDIVKNSIEAGRSSVKKRKSSDIPVNLLTHWYYLAVLESLSTKVASARFSHLAEHLHLSPYQFEDAIDFLSKNKLIVKTAAGWVKSDNHIYFPVGKAKMVIRNFHTQMIEKAKVDLSKNTSDEDFKKRMYLGYTFSADPKNIEQIKIKIQHFLSEITMEAGAGDCEAVYQCNFQLFPLMENK
ncbi:MAG: TIGR02147 family protein [Pseudobdellovibrionaceae bacterium]|jgi:uncharacterized protein (TIGR02147 family)